MKAFLKNSAIYISSELLISSANLILTPFYLVKLSLDEIGSLSIILASYTILQKLLNFGFQSGYTRYAFHKEFIDLKIFSLVWVHLTFNSLITFILMIALYFLPLETNTFNLAILILVTSGLRGTIVNNGLAILRVKEKVLMTGLIGISATLTTITPILLLINFKTVDSLMAIALGNIIGAITASALVMLFLKDQYRMSFPLNAFKKVFQYSKNLTFHGVFQWGMVSGDRFVLLALMNKNILGGYFVMYQAPLFVHLLFRAINNAILPKFSKASAMNDLKDSDLMDLKQEIKIYIYIIIALSIISLSIPFIPSLLPILSQFLGVYNKYLVLIPSLISGALFMALYYLPMNLITITKGETKNISSSTLSALLLGITINFFFLKTFGVRVAAFASMSSFGLLLILILNRAIKKGNYNKLLPLKSIFMVSGLNFIFSTLVLILK